MHHQAKEAMGREAQYSMAVYETNGILITHSSQQSWVLTDTSELSA